MNRKELRHDRHTVSLLTDHLVFSPKYRGKMLVGDVAMMMKYSLIDAIDLTPTSNHKLLISPNYFSFRIFNKA